MNSDYYQLVRDVNNAFETDDVDFLAAHVTDDVHWQVTGSESINGKADFIKCCSDTPFKTESLKITVTNILVDGDKAAADGIIEAETLTGKAYRQNFCDIYQFENGMVRYLSTYLDTAYDHAMLGCSDTNETN